MLLADREELWPRLEELGESKVRRMLARDEFESHETGEVQEWLSRRAAIETHRDARITKWVSIIGAVAAVTGAITGVWSLFSG